MASMNWFVYVLKCQNGHFYTGITNDVKRRFEMHQKGQGARYTRAFGAEKIVYQEAHATRSVALKREVEIKSWTRKQKLDLIRTKIHDISKR